MITPDIRLAGFHAAYDALRFYTRSDQVSTEVADLIARSLSGSVNGVAEYVSNEEIDLSRAGIFAALLAAADAMAACDGGESDLASKPEENPDDA